MDCREKITIFMNNVLKFLFLFSKDIKFLLHKLKRNKSNYELGA